MWPGTPRSECFDAIATPAFLAGCTERINLLVSVGVVPNRPAVPAAKLLLTADVLSGSQVVGGVGVGWMREAPGAFADAVSQSILPPCGSCRQAGRRESDPTGGRQMLSGTVDDMLTDVTALREAGVRR